MKRNQIKYCTLSVIVGMLCTDIVNAETLKMTCRFKQPIISSEQEGYNVQEKHPNFEIEVIHTITPNSNEIKTSFGGIIEKIERDGKDLIHVEGRNFGDRFDWEIKYVKSKKHWEISGYAGYRFSENFTPKDVSNFPQIFYTEIHQKAFSGTFLADDLYILSMDGIYDCSEWEKQ